MRRSNRFSAVAWQTCSVLALAGCGGGGSGGGTGPAPTISFSANPTSVISGGSSQLTWSVTNVASCTSSGGWSGRRDAAGTTSTGSLSATTTFALSCSSAGGTSQASVTVTVLPPPGITITATPRIVRTGVTSQLTWAVTDATSCEASFGWSGARPLSGTETVGPFTQDTTFTLICTGATGTAVASASVEFRAGANAPPTADADQNQTVFSTSTVVLGGANSSDDNGTVGFAWTQTAGPTVTLSDPGVQNPTFIAPTVAVDTVLTFSLTTTDDEGAFSAPDTVNVTVQPVPAIATIRGSVNYENIVFGPVGSGLNYAQQVYGGIQAEVLVEALDAVTLAVLASGRFAGVYQLNVPSQRDVVLRATAEMSRQAPLPLPHWQISVRDLDANGTPLGPIHSYTGPTFNSGPGVMQDLRIPSGWSTTGQLVGPRHSAPFAILDSLLLGLTTIVIVAPNADFPTLTIDWGPNNPGGETFFTRDASGARVIVLSAEPNVDTEEYDPFVILHEFGHYLDDAFSRSDSLGGPHSFGDRLDLRVAFSEGLATAFAGIAYGSNIYRDSFGPSQQSEAFFSIENDSATAEGWYSESSSQEILWDLFDTTNDGGDNVSVGLAAFWGTWQGPQRQTDALTSIFSFITALKQLRPSDAAGIDVLLANEQIVGSTMDIYGSTETNNAGSIHVLPVYTGIALGGSVVLRSTNEFGTPNKLSSHRFLRLSLPATTNVRFDLTAAAGRDPDIQVFRRGVPLAPDMGPSDETFTLNLAAGEYVLDVYDCGNAGCNQGVPAAPTDMTIAVTPN